MSKIKRPNPCRIVQYHPAGLSVFMPALVVWNDKTVINAAVFQNGEHKDTGLALIEFRRNIPHQIDAKEGEHYWTWPKRDDHVKPVSVTTGFIQASSENIGEALDLVRKSDNLQVRSQSTEKRT